LKGVEVSPALGRIWISLPVGVLLVLLSQARVASQPWIELDRGLFLGQFVSPQNYQKSDEPISILKVSPAFYALKLLSASEHGRNPRTAKKWCQQFRLLAAINASMYQNEYPLKSTGYMRNFDHTNNAHFNPVFGAFMVFNPTDRSHPLVQFVDRRLQNNWKQVIENYHTVIQNYRIISDGEKRGWPQQGRLHSTAAIGMDKRHNVLFIYSRSLLSTHDFIHVLLSLPIFIQDAMYLEGGPEAALYLNLEEMEPARKRIEGIGFKEYNDSTSALRIPNVIGIVRRN
jgi:hypothetical protein